MNTRTDDQRFLIVTRNVVVAEDLKEILQEMAASEVDTRMSIDEGWNGTYRLAFFDVPVERLFEDSRVCAMRRAGARVVVLDGMLDRERVEEKGVSILPQPFRSADVVALLTRLGFGPAAPTTAA